MHIKYIFRNWLRTNELAKNKTQQVWICILRRIYIIVGMPTDWWEKVLFKTHKIVVSFSFISFCVLINKWLWQYENQMCFFLFSQKKKKYFHIYSILLIFWNNFLQNLPQCSFYFCTCRGSNYFFDLLRTWKEEFNRYE